MGDAIPILVKNANDRHRVSTTPKVNFDIPARRSNLLTIVPFLAPSSQILASYRLIDISVTSHHSTWSKSP